MTEWGRAHLLAPLFRLYGHIPIVLTSIVQGHWLRHAFFFLILKKLFILIGGELLYEIVMVSATCQYELAIGIQVWPPS